ncbi:hypothetical protein ZIOFF_068145 [Zingiber officinale]|uniref:Chromatin modification-related protein MEAF6 n=1 Tax=Zingiber officinale TaxID=94328 RepID=A0A8J5CEC0_ZINOF|nr:hypothetical protein ZIOFF_068145 [Zingiber officinale]
MLMEKANCSSFSLFDSIGFRIHRLIRSLTSIVLRCGFEKWILLGQRASSNPSAVLTAFMSKREKLQDELRAIERQVYDLETTYLQDSNQNGSVLKGFEGFLSSSKSTAKFLFLIEQGSGSGLTYLRHTLDSDKNTICNCISSLKRSRKFQPEDRLFSLSSITSPAVFTR